MKLLALCCTAVAIASADARAEGPSVTWYVVTEALHEQGDSLSIGDALQEVPLHDGWSCTVGETSKQLPTHEARQTVCRNLGTSFEFSVTCERSKPKDHTQIRLGGRNERFADYIEVGCELIEMQ